MECELNQRLVAYHDSDHRTRLRLELLQPFLATIITNPTAMGRNWSARYMIVPIGSRETSYWVARRMLRPLAAFLAAGVDTVHPWRYEFRTSQPIVYAPKTRFKEHWRNCPGQLSIHPTLNSQLSTPLLSCAQHRLSFAFCLSLRLRMDSDTLSVIGN